MFQGSGGCSVPMVTFSLLISNTYAVCLLHTLLCIDVHMQIEPLSRQQKSVSVQFCVPV